MPKLVTVLRPEKIDEHARMYVRSYVLFPAGTIGLICLIGYTDALQGRLGEFVDQHKGSNLRSVVFPWSSYGQGIAQYAKEVKADLVILGTRGHTSLRYVLLGSTAERLLRELPCSVLTIRPGDAETILPIP